MRNVSVAVVLVLLGGCGAEVVTPETSAPRETSSKEDDPNRLPLVDTVPSQSPAPLSVSIGLFHSAAIDAGGNALCWGRGLDWNDPTPLETALRPVSCGPSGETFTAISAGETNTCAIRTDGIVRCWGSGPAVKPTDDQVGRAIAISVGTGIACALLEDGAVWCAGQLPPKRQDLPEAATHIDVNGGLACARLVSGKVSCWGNDHGHGTIEAAARVTSAKSIAVGYNHACALVDDGILCWGANYYGQIGNGATDGADVHEPVRVGDGIIVSPIAVSAGVNDSCALSGSGAVHCWGWNTDGQIGDGTSGDPIIKKPGELVPTTEDRHVPTLVRGLSRGATSIVMGGYSGMAILSTGVVAAWGMNHLGQIGDGTKEERPSPVPVQFP